MRRLTTSNTVPCMMAGDVSHEVRRWKLIALASVFVAVAAVAGLIGWIARGSGDANVVTIATFTGGGWTSSSACESVNGTRFAIRTVVKILDADGNQLAIGKIVADPVHTDGSCRQEFAVDGIPGGRGVYLVEVGRWRHTVSEAQLRGNMAEVLLI
jgi:hypothetical protein